jgi:type IV pilus assembly protein PilX
MSRRKPFPSSQRGVVLIATMILLVLLTILALTAVSMNSTQTRVAANSADQQVAYETAEGVLSQAESNVIAGLYPTSAFAANAAGLYIFDATAGPVWQTNASLWSTPGATISTGFGGGSSQPGQFVIELLPPVIKPGQAMNAQTQVYRVTAYGVGQSGKSPVILQATMQVQ